MKIDTITAEELAEAFHENYERLAPSHGYETRDDSRTEWKDVPEKNKKLMVATATAILIILRGGHSAEEFRSHLEGAAAAYADQVGLERARKAADLILEVNSNPISFKVLEPGTEEEIDVNALVADLRTRLPVGEFLFPVRELQKLA